jgi:hypothetical protein
LILVGTTLALEKTISGESFHTIPITHGILKCGPLDGDPPNDENGGPSRGGPRSNGPSKKIRYVLYPIRYAGPIASTPHMIQKSFSYPIYKEGTNSDVHCEKTMGNVKRSLENLGTSQQIKEGQQKRFDLWPLS